MNKKNILWKLLLIIGLIPFVIPFLFGIIKAIIGDSLGLCFVDCKISYGLPVFLNFVSFYSFVYWPTYVIGIILIIISIVQLLKHKKLNITKK